MSANKQKLKIYNSLSSKKEVFKSINKDFVGMYVCGPTVYNTVHLGNCRTFISFDLIFRYLKHLGYNVRYVRNITDVGHLEENEEDDKILKRAQIEKIEPMEVVQKYTNEFHLILDKFNLNKPNIEPSASGHIIEQIEMIQEIIDAGYAYEKNGSVYFDTLTYNKNNNYGILSNRDLVHVINESRELEGTTEKNNQQDFALWKKANKKHLMKWNSPWGYGFPGWHLECSAMSKKYLGEKFDIHGGGLDLKFPHHDCEIAQCKSLSNEIPANYWLHTNMLTLNGKKMSKSTGNSVLPFEIFNGSNKIFSKSYPAMVLKFFIFQAHYRNTLDLSDEALKASEKAYEKIKTIPIELNSIIPGNENDCDAELWIKNCYNSLNDDFNSPKLIAEFFNLYKNIQEIKSKSKSIDSANLKKFQEYFSIFYTDILGFDDEKSEKNQLDEVLDILLEIRDNERDKKNYEVSDLIRDKLSKLGININDKQ